MVYLEKPLLVLLHLLYLPCLRGQDIRELGSFEMRRPGFTELYEHTDPADPTERYSFIVSTFNPIPGTVDEVFFVTYPGKYLDNPSATPYEIVGEGYTWPREPDHIPGMGSKVTSVLQLFSTANIIFRQFYCATIAYHVGLNANSGGRRTPANNHEKWTFGFGRVRGLVCTIAVLFGNLSFFSRWPPYWKFF